MFVQSLRTSPQIWQSRSFGKKLKINSRPQPHRLKGIDFFFSETLKRWFSMVSFYVSLGQPVTFSLVLVLPERQIRVFSSDSANKLTILFNRSGTPRGKDDLFKQLYLSILLLASFWMYGEISIQFWQTMPLKKSFVSLNCGKQLAFHISVLSTLDSSVHRPSIFSSSSTLHIKVASDIIMAATFSYIINLRKKGSTHMCGFV
jgi:hypothetical protein